MTGWLAHGVGTQQDLPLPLNWTIAAAATAVAVSFAAMGVLWRQPHVNGRRAGRPLPAGVARVLDAGWFRAGLSTLGLLCTGYALLALIFGPDHAGNPAPWIVYVLIWVGLVPLSVLFGPVWRLVNPLRAIHRGVNRLAGLDPAEGLRPLPAALGYWPAAAGLLAFTWLELVYPDNNTLPTLRLAIGLYVLVQLFASLLYGSRWFDRGDAIEVWSTLFGRLSPLGRRADGGLVLRSPLAGLDALRPAPGLAATVMVMLGSTAYDGLSGSPAYVGWAQSAQVPRLLVDTLTMVGVIALLGLVYVGCTAAAGLLGEPGTGTWRQMPAAFAHSVVPVALGYVVAHYYTLFVLEGQQAFVQLTDPLGTGADWLGTAGAEPATGLIDPSIVVNVQVAAIVLGHIVGVVLAHDRAVRLFPRRRAVIGQLPLLGLMLAFTGTGLFLLYAA